MLGNSHVRREAKRKAVDALAAFEEGTAGVITQNTSQIRSNLKYLSCKLLMYLVVPTGSNPRPAARYAGESDL